MEPVQRTTLANPSRAAHFSMPRQCEALSPARIRLNCDGRVDQELFAIASGVPAFISSPSPLARWGSGAPLRLERLYDTMLTWVGPVCQQNLISNRPGQAAATGTVLVLWPLLASTFRCKAHPCKHRSARVPVTGSARALPTPRVLPLDPSRLPSTNRPDEQARLAQRIRVGPRPAVRLRGANRPVQSHVLANNPEVSHE